MFWLTTSRSHGTFSLAVISRGKESHREIKKAFVFLWNSSRNYKEKQKVCTLYGTGYSLRIGFVECVWVNADQWSRSRRDNLYALPFVADQGRSDLPTQQGRRDLPCHLSRIAGLIVCGLFWAVWQNWSKQSINSLLFFSVISVSSSEESNGWLTNTLLILLE